jgi:hypothetical protein
MSYNSELQGNNEELQAILDAINDLPDASSMVAAAVSEHNVNTDAHNDIRLLVQGLAARLNAFANSTDEDLDTAQEFMLYIKANRDLISQITTSKVSVADIVNNLTSNVTNKPLSAAQGVALKALIDALDKSKLGTSELSEAITAALEQAKESGEFDGADGKTPVKGTDYFTPTEKSAFVADVKASLPKLTMVGTDADGVEHTWTIYGS